MPHFSVQQVREIISDADRIRNVSFIGGKDLGKSILTGLMSTKAAITYTTLEGKEEFTMIKQNNSLDSRYVSICHETNIVNEKDTLPYLINLTDNPSELYTYGDFTSSLRLADSVLIFVDCVSGITTDAENALRQALCEKLKPILVLNKLDRALLALQLSNEELYTTLERIIESVNVIISTYANEDMDESQLVDPAAGTVIFSSTLFNWAFTLTPFAKLYSQKFNIPHEEFIQKLWGDNFFNPGEKSFKQSNEDGKSSRTFELFVLDPIQKILKHVRDGNLDVVKVMMGKLHITSSEVNLQDENKDALFNSILQAWFNATDTFIETIILKLPSPKKAQQYRAAYLYEGDISDPCGQAIKNCDREGPLMISITKMLRSAELGRFLAYGRVFSGTASKGQTARIMNPKYQPGSKKHVVERMLPHLFIVSNGFYEGVEEAPCGSTIAIPDIDQYLINQGTISDNEQASCIKLKKESRSAFMKVAVQPKDPQHLPKLIEGLKRLAKSDKLVDVFTEESGEHVVGSCDEQHLEFSFKMLEEEHAKIPLRKSDFFVAYRESVNGNSDRTVLTKSPNKHNRLFCTASPLGEELARGIDDEDITAEMDADIISKHLFDDYKWDANDAKKLWCFGPDGEGANLVVDMSKGVSYLDEIKESFVAGFQWATKEGVLADENMRGVRINIVDVTLHADGIHRSGGQIIPTARRVVYCCQLISQPILQEPIMLVDLRCPLSSTGSIYSIMTQREGTITSEDQDGKMVQVRAYLPLRQSLGFRESLRSGTGGKGTFQMVFDHWQEYEGNALDPSSAPGKVVTEIRVRKGLSEAVKTLDNFEDKL